MKNKKLKRVKSTHIPEIILLIFVVLTIAPIYIMIVTSLKDQNQIVTNFWGIPTMPHWENYSKAWSVIRKYVLNSFVITPSICVGVIMISVFAGYAFAKLELPAKELLFTIVLMFQMIPVGLLLIPMYLNILSLHLNDTYWGVILPGIAGGSIVATVLSRSFFEGIPDSVFEAARIDGAKELVIVLRMVMPLSLPIMGTIFLQTFFSKFNEFMWPFIVLSSDKMRTIPVGLNQLAGQYGVDYGLQMAAYCIVSIPLIALIVCTMKIYIGGVTVGAVKE